jgi:carboxymethylenebutenolidase
MTTVKQWGVALVGALLWLGSNAAMADTRTVNVGVNGHMQAQLISPDGPGPYPAVLLLHTSGGLQMADLEYAHHLMLHGYVVLLPEFLAAYGITYPTRQLTFTDDAAPLYADFVACLQQLSALPNVDGKRLAAIGFSNGGYFALWLAARGQVQAGVSYYGALSGAGTDKTLLRFRQLFNHASSPVLILHGDDDSTVSIDYAQALDTLLTGAHSPHAFYQYAGAGHRFERSNDADDQAAAKDAWMRTLGFLADNLQPAP